MTDIKLSIVVPTYNVEKYLEKCLRSCVIQNIPPSEYEIIVVNDGSKDNSLSIAESFASNYSNVYVISQVNKGLSAARNKGLQRAQGEYVWFIDSDDWIKENCLNDLMSYCKDIDILCLGYIMDFEDGTQSIQVMPQTPLKNRGIDLLCTNNFCVPAQFYVYKKTFLINNQLRFFEGIFHEDMEFTPRMLYKASCINIYPTPVYYYFIRANSITTTVNSKKSFDLIKVAKNLHAFYTEYINDEEAKNTFSYYISMNINNALSLARSYSKKEKGGLNKSLGDNRILFIHLKKSPMIKYKIEGYLFSMFPSHCLSIYTFLSNLK